MRTPMAALVGLFLVIGPVQAGEFRLFWDTVPGATIQYNVYVGSLTGVYGASERAIANSYIATVLDGGPYFACIKTFDTATGLESDGCSNEVSSWARATIVGVSTLPQAPLEYTAQIHGTNFSPEAVATITYPGLTQGVTTRISAEELHVNFTLAPNTAGGSAPVTVTNPWTDMATGLVGVIGPTQPDAVTVIPVIPPPPPANAGLE